MIRPSLALVAVLLAGAGFAQTAPMEPDMIARYDAVRPQADYIRREVMIPMRDGVKLFTVIVMRKGTTGGPMLLTRTPYDAGKTSFRNRSQKIEEILPVMDAEFVNDGYIRVYQDVRGIHKSEGDYVMNRPLRGPLNATAVDNATDAYDSIDWLVKNVPESNGKVGITGSSYPGFTALMALIDPHPALKAAVPQSPMVDGWMGDDWFHNGAFRQNSFDYFGGQTAKAGTGPVPYGSGDEYDIFLGAGSAGNFATLFGLEQFPAARKMMEHPAYDSYWQEQALDRILAKQPLRVPTLWMGALWDQEDMWGAIHAYQAVEPKDATNTMNYLALGPWRHSGTNYEQRELGQLKLPGDTATEFRLTVLKPFLDSHLKTGAPKADIAPVTIFETGTMRWGHYSKWPLACGTGCDVPSKPLYLTPGLGLSFEKPATGAAFEEYTSDPAKPVPYVRRPVRWDDQDQWRYWLVSDQRHVDGRPDVVTFVTEPLKAPLRIAGEPVVNLYASTSGTDADWVVKLIDVYPDVVPSDVAMGGYQLGVAMDIFRGRYRDSFEKPTAIPPGRVQTYRFGLPPSNHTFLPGHRVMVQIQSSWFPLYDRNPQTFVPNIFFAKSGDYKKATQRIYLTGDTASSIELPVVPAR